MRNNNPLVTIITVVLNNAKYIEGAIQSILSQKYKNIEHIIIDGGSNDGTVEIINKYSGKISQFISEPDNGFYDALNKGINLSNGDVVGILNSDDEFYDCLEWANKKLMKNFYDQQKYNTLEQIEYLYRTNDAEFRGFRHNNGGDVKNTATK
ncbi:MAG TPA: glycosyltransferase, partial [Flavobacteriales bacterium]|nr:glycosyltransferase [Flavobacteriales bacterium]